MKALKLLLLAAALGPTLMQAQVTHDSAAAAVDRYLAVLNYEALPHDSMLVLNTVVSYHGMPDTFYMERLYAYGEMHRVIVRNKAGEIVTGLCTNGTDRYREYSTHEGWWVELSPDIFADKLQPYDFRGPLYRWRERGIQLTYQGTSENEGHLMQTVKAEQLNRFTRYYLFDTENSLMVLFKEVNQAMTGSISMFGNPVDWKVLHEYQPLGASLIVRQESYLRNGVLTIMETEAHFTVRDNLLFNQDVLR